jgi:hypothetical protein
MKTIVNQNSTYRIYIDNVYIYWTQAMDEGGVGLYRMPISGGVVQNIYNRASWNVTGDDKHIYWATYFQLLSKNK